jgi:CheY-like chemotaxis protein
MNTGDPWPPFRVLCVDDNRDCADSAALLLRVMGFESRACYDGHTALALNESFRPGICFLDLNMPGMDGDEVAVTLRRGTGWRPLLLIAMTAMSNEASCDRITAAGFDMHLIKPVDPAKLVEVVDLLFRVAESAKPVADRSRSSGD